MSGIPRRSVRTDTQEGSSLGDNVNGLTKNCPSTLMGYRCRGRGESIAANPREAARKVFEIILSGGSGNEPAREQGQQPQER
jgi:hypothetical protein